MEASRGALSAGSTLLGPTTSATAFLPIVTDAGGNWSGDLAAPRGVLVRAQARFADAAIGAAATNAIEVLPAN